MSKNTKRLLIAIAIMVAAAIGLSEKTHALKAPHDSSWNITKCGECHSRTGFKNITGFNNLCFNSVGCHRAGGKADRKRFSTKDASDRFGSVDPFRTSTGVKNSSHAWKVPAENPNAGVPAGNKGLIGGNLKEDIRTLGSGRIYCNRCHRAMGTGGTVYDKFLRADPTGNYVCMQCHTARRTDNVREPKQTGFDYSHPVEVNYSTARAAKPDFYQTTFRLATGYLESARVRLYTTHESTQASIIGSSRLAGKNAGAVVCQTCHGPIHSADSNPYTFDNLSAYSKLSLYSSSVGNLLRQYPIAGPRASNNLCLSCHKVEAHKGFLCGRCHTPHKKPNENNRYLILENISTPSNGKRSVVFTSRSEMAARYQAGYSSSLSRLNPSRQVSSRICQVCHTATVHHRNYSSPGGTVDRTHNIDVNNKYFFCPNCHKHTSGFTPSGCSTCHGFPPSDNNNFKHGKHTNGNVEPVPSNTFWKTGRVTDNRGDSSYGFSCGRCHSRWAPYTATAGDGYQGKNHYGIVSPSNNYTTDIGFRIRTTINSLPWNPSGGYTYNGTNRILDGSGSQKWWGAGDNATCRDLYCHGQFYNGYTSNNPTAKGTQGCGSCHGASRTDPPGKTNNANFGAHPRHVGSANNQQYGSGAPNFRCNACHARTSDYNNETTVTSRKYHVNGRVNIRFDNASTSGFRVGNANSNYGGGVYNDYTSRAPKMSVKPAYNTCKLIYCHSNGTRTWGNYSAPNNAGIGTGNNRFPNWSSSRNFTTTMNINGYSMKTRCARCHGNTTYKGITMAMPNYTGPAYGGPKENSHRKHVIENKFRCNACHSSTINSANNAIASTQNHVNKFYNISIIALYRDNGIGGNYDANAKTCSSIKCHAGRTTPAWGSKIGCTNCHLSSAGDVDKRIRSNNGFQNFSGKVEPIAPKIYSTAWTDTGHGRSSGGRYYSYDGQGNFGADRVCTDCHKASVPHGTGNNPFRLYTLNSVTKSPNTLCEDCHGVNPGNPVANKTDILTHASSVTKTGRYNFSMKCVDCHDPHGDGNKFMLHSTIARPRITGTTRRESSGQYGSLLLNITGRNVDFVSNQYTSDYGRKSKADKICQVCHTQTKDVSSPYGGRFRWYSAADKSHGGAKCTNCHSHTAGFKGAGCDYCHGWPPTGLQNIISGAGRINPTKKRASSSNTAGAHFKHYTTFMNVGSPSLTKTTVCGLCHKDGMYPNGAESGDIELGFNAFGVYTTGKYRGQSAVATGFYGYSGKAASIGTSSGNNDNTLRCQNVKCHGGGGWLSKNFGNATTPKWNDTTKSTVFCGSCHGAKKAAGSGTWPTSNRHEKHAGTAGYGYDLMCRTCHGITVLNTATTLSKANHVTGTVQVKFTSDVRVNGSSTYSGDTVVNSGWGYCQNLYCHSRGTSTQAPYTSRAAYPNYTAKWDLDISGWNAGERCSLCHGSKKSAGGYAGITSAMPNQANQAHKKHVVDNGFKCYFCHSATVSSTNTIVSTGNHVNRFKNISIIEKYRQGPTNYSATVSTKKTCKNVRCHAGKTTPLWTVSYDAIKCTDCHYSNTSDTDEFTWTNFSGSGSNSVAARIYSTEWTKRGHGKSKTSGKYPFSNNTGAQRDCANCHKPAVKHGDQNNYFRLYSSNSDSLCLSCHGRGTQLNAWGQGYSDITGIQSHTWNNISTNGYNGGTNGKAAANGGWNFGQHDGTDQKKTKCVDCHDPHGDRNNYMLHSYINMSGSDRVGRPNPNAATALMIFTAVGGPQLNWSSYVKNAKDGICQRCHSDMAQMINFNKATYSGHNARKRCTDCHKHKKGFAPAGCDSCHAYPPPNAPTTLGWNTYADDMSNISSLHIPHAWNKRQRPGIPTTENDVDSVGGKGANERGYFCYRCHGGAIGGNGQSDTHGQGYPSKQNASMKNLTMLDNGVRTGRWSPGALAGGVSVTDDTCWNVSCHTPRYYTRQWKKPTGCGDCHGYRNKAESAAQAFKIQTTGVHKIHINYSTPGIAGTDYKKYGLLCSNCHYDWQALNNYSTHYSNYVNMTANGPVNTVANMKVKDGQFYTKGRSFKGFTTGNETFGTCAKAYCHGNFTNGTTATLPNWKKGVSPVTCISCHKGRLTFNNGSTMPERHQKHVKTNQYGFACAKCHMRTTNNITTVIFNYSSHVNGRKDVYFNSDLNNGSGSFASASRQCSNTYCHSKGYRFSGSYFATRTTLANYTADWDVTAEGRAGTGKGCSFCHGNKTYAGITAAMPNQTSTWGNSHRTHVIGNKFRCVNCHAATVNAAGQIATYSNHVNGFKNISIIAMYKSGQTLYSSQMPSVNKTCKNVKCHAGKTTPKWGTSANCKNCHFVATGSDTDDYASFRSFTGTAAKIYSTEWASKGHGSVGKNIQCTNCHKAAAPHDGKDGSGNVRNPYRLLTSQSVALCGNCHGTASERNKWGSEYIASAYQDIKTHTKADTTGDAAWNTHSTAQGRAVKCVDCHDPHGDKNKKMVHALINMSGSDRFGRPKGRPWADGSDPAVTAQMTFTSFGGQVVWSSFANNNLSRSICRRCHTPKGQDSNMGNVPVGNEGEQTKDNYAYNHQPSHASKCTSCHQHSKGFKGAKCDSCHGFPPVGTFNLLSGAGRTNETKMRASGNATIPGAHGRHTTILLQNQASGDRSALCNYCHSGGMGATGSDDGNITLKFGAGTFAQYTGGLYKGQTVVRDGFYGYSGYPGMKNAPDDTLRCQNVKCHGAQGNWLTASYGATTAPKWDDKNTAKCGKCHGAKKSSTVGSWPISKAHAIHAGTDNTKQQNLMCRNCHGITVLGTATTLSKANHVNAAVYVELTSAGGSEPRIGGDSAYTGDNSVNKGFGQCNNVYCHSTGTDRVAPYGEAPNFAATWTTIRGSYKKSSATTAAKCNFCHGNQTWRGVTSAMPNYGDGSPKANKHPKHVFDYNFLCSSCHDSVVANNTSIRGDNYGLHVNRSYNVNFSNTAARGIENAQGKYTSIGSRCESTYCHSRGVDLVSPFSRITTLSNYTAKWGDSRGGINTGNGSKPNMTRCNYCHGNGAAGGDTAAAPNYTNGTPKSNRHPMHVTTYGFTCSACHVKVTTNNTSIDAAGGIGLHVNKTYNINFSNAAPFSGNTGLYKGYDATAPGSKCLNTYCHSRGTDVVAPYNTRTSFANWTARWGDNRNGYRPAAIGQKAKCNYCHGNRAFGGVTAAMPNYTGTGTNTAKWNAHPVHVRSYGFTCTICHVKTTANNTSIDASGGKALHVNKAYNVNFKAGVRGNLTNNTGVYSYISQAAKSRCKNTYCHSRGTDFTKPYNTRTSLANFTAMWGDTRLGYKQARGVKAKCNYCHGNRSYSGLTSAMPNYSGTDSAKTAKANSHRAHVVNNGILCSTCHYGVVPNNTSISDRVNHVNGFYNISITPQKKLGAGKAYSSVYGPAGGFCMNNTCHGTSKPQWGNSATANCKSCHRSTTGDTDSYGKPNDNKVAAIYSTEWARKGHGAFAPFTSRAQNRCLRCHNSGVSHNYAQSPLSNPFRLWTSQTDALCANCHGVSSERNKAPWGGWASNQYTGILTHSKGNTAGNAAWNTHTSVPSRGAKCVDCHDPHGDKNKKMIHSYINHSGSDRFGRPARPPLWNNATSNMNTQMTFTSHGGLIIWSSFVNNNRDRSICRRCHTPKAQEPGLAIDMSKENYADTHQNHSEKCTLKCHMHKTGFKPTGESQGNEDCKGCHGTGDLFEKMQATNNYHHVMINTSAAAGSSKYPNQSSFGPSDQKSSRRRCLMCHVDHNVFRPDINTDGTGGRARNLRWSVFDKGNTGIATDFWPAKRKNATGRTGSDAGTGNYSSTMPISGPSSYNGVCMSCHKNVQYKNTTLVNDDIQVQRARNFPVNLYTSSSHNFQVISASFVYGTGSSKSRFRGNCTKCHRTSGSTNDLSKSGAQSGRWPVALHDKNVPSLLMDIATSSSKPMLEQLCYNCHDTLARASNGPGSMDFYSSIKMNSGAKMIKTAVTGKRYIKPIEDEAQAGMHKIDEYYKADASVAEDTNPSVLWNYSTGAAGGVGRHVECVDCHNTHGGNASIRRLAGAPFRGKLNTQQAAYFNYTRDTGNKIAGAQKGVWGVSLTYGTTRGTTPAFTKIAQVTYQYEVCLKCHSRYAYGNNPPGVPDGLPDPTGTIVTYFDNLVPDVPQSDISRMINPNNYGYHPIYKKGRNQPPKSIYAGWPATKSNWMYKDRFNNKTAFISVSGLSWAFVPPFSQHSLLACTDCHVADNSGKALGKYKPDSNPTAPSFTNATKVNIEKNGDGRFTSTGTGGATLEVSVTCPTIPGPSPDSNGLNVVVYGRTSSTGSNNTRTQTLDVYRSGVIQGATGTVTFAKYGAGAFGRYERNVGTWTSEAWSNIESLYTVKFTANGGTYNVDIDYIGIEVQYTTTADVRGPHGSMERWLLTDLDTDVWFDANNSGTLTYDATDRPNSKAWADPVDNKSKTFCWNCHRSDVYNYVPKYQYSRMQHNSTGNNNPWFDGTNGKNVWGIVCMNCHAGGGIGEIHGSFANSTTAAEFNTGRYNLNRPRGVRLMNGAVFNFDPTTNTCYTPSAANTPYGASCTSHSSGGQTAVTNYSYTTW